MSYIVLARKWRPRSFEEIIGQEYIVRTLENAVQSGRIAHAMIFSGPHGVGKTSTARVLAKELNRKASPQDPESEVSFYEEIEEGRSLDVIEIDAASHTGVNDVREIIENIKYMPSSGTTKVYIIDEAHMLSQSAFNALLKSLEEPPAHILFILATTEVHKIPPTILSRCQRYEFKRVPTVQIKERLEHITREEGIQISPDTLFLLAEEAQGSMRDALSLLDQLIATFGTSIEEEDAVRVLGLSDRALIKGTFKALLNHDPKGALEALNEATAKGTSPKRFAEDLLKLIRHALIIKACGTNLLRDLSEQVASSIQAMVEGTTTETLEMLFKLALSGAEEVNRSAYPRMALEASIVKLALVRNVIPIEEVIKRLEVALAKGGSVGAGGLAEDETLDAGEDKHAAAPSKGLKGKRSTDKISESVSPAQPDQKNSDLSTNEPPPPDSPRHNPSINLEQGFIDFVRSNSAMIASHLEEASRIYLENSTLNVQFPSESIHTQYLRNKKRLKHLEEYASKHFNQKLSVKILVSKAHNGPLSKKKSEEELNRSVLEDPLIAHALNIFGGKIIRIKPQDKE